MSIELLSQLKALHLYGMATAWSELQAEKPKPIHRPETWLERMLVAEQTDRQLKSLRYQLKAARFPIHRDLLGIDWSETPLTQAVMEQLATAAFMEEAHNLILVGGTGTGKTHLATALGVAAIHHGKRVRFYNAVDLVNQLEKEKQQGKAGNLARQSQCRRRTSLHRRQPAEPWSQPLFPERSHRRPVSAHRRARC